MNRRRTVMVALATALLLSAAVTPAQDIPGAVVAAPEPPVELSRGDGRIKGTVSGPERKRLVAAQVVARVSLVDRDVIFLTTTDDSGTYYFEDLPGGEYLVEAYAPGMARGRYDVVRIRPPFRTILDFRLLAATAAAPAADAPAGTSSESLPSVPGRPDLGVPVVGLVLGEGQAALPDAEIAFNGGPPPGQRRVLSRQDGRLELNPLPIARYELTVTAPGTIPIRIPDVGAIPGRPLELAIRLVDYPVEMAARRSVILPAEEPYPPRRYLTIPPPPELPEDLPPEPPPPEASPRPAPR